MQGVSDKSIISKTQLTKNFIEKRLNCTKY